MEISLKAVAVTGAGSGLGRAVALGLAIRGVSVMCLDTSEEGLAETVLEIRRRDGRAETLVADVASELAVATAFSEIASRAYELDGLVTCAGVQNTTKILDLTLSEWERVLAINLTGTFLCIQNALRAMLPRGRGRIVTIASDTGKRGGGRVGKAAYGASKGGVVVLTRSVAREIAPLRKDIRINCLCPGPMLTNMHAGLPDETMTMAAASVPVGRFGTVEEVAAGVLFLLSDEASFVFGETLCVDGGVVMD